MTTKSTEGRYAGIEEQAGSHDRWFRSKVQASLADTGPRIPHDEAMARIDAIIDAAEQKSKGRLPGGSVCG